MCASCSFDGEGSNPIGGKVRLTTESGYVKWGGDCLTTLEAWISSLCSSLARKWKRRIS